MISKSGIKSIIVQFFFIQIFSSDQQVIKNALFNQDIAVLYSKHIDVDLSKNKTLIF